MQNFESGKWLEAHKDIDNIRAVIFDLNGVMRGKRLPLAQLDKAIRGGLRIPLSAPLLTLVARLLLQLLLVCLLGGSVLAVVSPVSRLY